MITPKQAEALVRLLFGKFSTVRRITYKGIFFRIANGRLLSVSDSIDPELISFIKTKEDLALIALVDLERSRAKACFSLIKEVLTSEQLLELLKIMLHLKVTDKTRESSSDATVSALLRSDTIAAYIFLDLLMPSKKAFSDYIKDDCHRLINAIFQDVIIANKGHIPDMVPSQYVISEACGKIISELLPRINTKILEFLHQDPIIKYLCTLFKHYALYDGAAKGKEAIDILLGNLANRVVSSVLSHHIAVFTDADRDELNNKSEEAIQDERTLVLLRASLNNSIANRFLSKIFTYLIATDSKDKPVEHQNISVVFHPFLLNPAHKAPYVEYCMVTAVDITICPKISEQKIIKGAAELGKDFLKQELLLGLWLAIEEIYDEFKPFAKNLEPIKFLTIPKTIREITDQISSLLHLGNIDKPEGQFLSNLLKRFEKLNLIHMTHFPQQSAWRGISGGKSLSPPPRGPSSKDETSQAIASLRLF